MFLVMEALLLALASRQNRPNSVGDCCSCTRLIK